MWEVAIGVVGGAGSREYLSSSSETRTQPETQAMVNGSGLPPLF